MKCFSTQLALVWRFLTLSLALLCSFGFSQSITISAPETKEVSPGDFVSLVFRLTAEQDTEIDISASSSSSWTILKQIGKQKLLANKAKPVVVTVAVPVDAKANQLERLSLKLSTSPELIRDVELSVKEFRSLDVHLKDELILGQDDLDLQLNNQGNVTENVTVKLRYSGENLQIQALNIAPFSQESIVFTPLESGIYFVDLFEAETLLFTKSFRVLDTSAAEPAALRLAGAVTMNATNTGAFTLSSRLSGALSDFVQVSTELNLTQPESFFLALDSNALKVRAGRLANNPFGLSLNTGFGLSGSYSFENTASVSSSLSWVEANKFAAHVAGKYQNESITVTAGTGLYAGQVAADINWSSQLEPFNVQARASFVDDALNLQASSDFSADLRSLSVDFSASRLFTTEAGLAGGFNLQQDELGLLYGGLNYPFELAAARNAFLGLNTRIPTALPGEIDTTIQLGFSSSHVAVRYNAMIEAGWQTSSGLALRSDTAGFGILLDSRWLATVSDSLAINTNLAYYPASALFDAELELEGIFEPNPSLELPVFGSWRLQDENLEFGAGLLWASEFGLTLDLNNSLSFDYGSQDWRYNLALSSAYSFGFDTPDALSDLAGGRNLGTLKLKIVAEGEPIAGVKVTVGQSLFTTDEAGEIQIELTPNDYEVKLDKNSLAVTYQLISNATATANIRFQEETELIFEATFASAIEGRIFADNDANGLPDANPKGVFGSLLLTDASGLRRQIISDAEGFFSVSQVSPGSTTLKLISVTKGGIIIGEESLVLNLEPKKIAEAQFFVQPAEARSQSFNQKRVRIRQITLEADPVPAGSAPLVIVELSGELDALSLRSDYSETALSLKDGLWQGRLNVPQDTAEGLLSFEVIGEQNGETISKKGRLQINAEAIPYLISLNAPVQPSETLSIEVQTWLEATKISVNSEFGELELSELSDGLYGAELVIPEDANDAVYSLSFLFETASGNIEHEETFRVLIR